jgi:hypothetical protein
MFEYKLGVTWNGNPELQMYAQEIIGANNHDSFWIDEVCRYHQPLSIGSTIILDGRRLGKVRDMVHFLDPFETVNPADIESKYYDANDCVEVIITAEKSAIRYATILMEEARKGEHSTSIEFTTLDKMLDLE